MRIQSVRWRIARRHINHRKKHRLRWVMAFAVLLVLATAGGAGAGAYYFVSNLPSASAFHIRYAFQNARIYDSRGDLLYDMADLGKAAGRRVVEPLQARHDRGNPCRGGVNRIPVILQNATIATEDATFYKNPGFDLPSIVRAAYDDLRVGHIVSGASTITQQVVRDAHLVSDKRTFSRKAQEIALAYELSKRFSKRKILWFYLNSVPYGNTAIGAQAAAQVYFHRKVCALDSAQAAFLAGLPRAPSLYNPVLHRARALARMQQVLRVEKRHSYLRHLWQIGRQMNEARYWRFSPPQANMRFPHFTRYVIDQLKSRPKLRAQLYKGIDVYTTIDPTLQDMAQTTVTQQIDSLVAQHVTDGALVSMDIRPKHYGWILAMVGSANYGSSAGQINMTISPRQPGSSMKPFNYIYAFQHGVAPGTTIEDSPVQLPDPNAQATHGWYDPSNYDQLFHGQVTLRQALANSLNVPAVKVEYYITGSDHVAQTAYRFGMKSLYHDNPHLACSVCYSVTLGGLAAGTRLLQETSAYGVFASGGVTVPPVAIWKVVKRSTGKVIYCSSDCPKGVKADPFVAKAPKRVLDPAHAYEMTDVLSDNNARCTPQVCEFGLDSALLLSHPAAAKTGTTNAFTDNWTVGYTPQILTGVWVGNADHSAMRNVIGVTGAAPIWHTYMENAFKIMRLPSVGFVTPPGVLRTTECTGTSTPIAGSTQPASTYTTSSGTSDIYIKGDKIPLCRIPERGVLPVSCNDYPKPVPYYWECVLNPPAGTYRFYPDASGQYYTGQYTVPTAGPYTTPGTFQSAYPTATALPPAVP